MKKLTIAEASIELGISKEAIHNRIRRGSLECLIENGVKFVILDTENKTIQKRANNKIQVIQNDNRYYNLIEEQNKKLQEKVDSLELEVKELREQREKMLIAEKLKIEDIYIQKDKQLKSILGVITANSMLNLPQKEIHDIEIVEVPKVNEKKEKFISLNKYLEKKKLPKKKILKIKSRVKEIAKKDNRIEVIKGKYFIQPSLYDYNDIF